MQCVAPARVWIPEQAATRRGQGGRDGNGTKQERAKSPGVACHPGLLDPALATRGPAAVELWTQACLWSCGTLNHGIMDERAHVRIDQKDCVNSLAVCRGQPLRPQADGHTNGKTEITAQEEQRLKNRLQACAMESRTNTWMLRGTTSQETRYSEPIERTARNVPGNRANPKSKAARHSLSRQPYRSSTPCVLPAGRSEKKDARQRPKCDSETSDPEPSVPSYTENTEMEQRQEGIGTRLVTSRLP